MRPTLLIAAALLCGGLYRADAAERPVVVELFTSQSCSSCPPAEALIGRLAREPAGARGDVLPLAFHVTYWNHLDWRDRYALPAATARQEAYADRLGGSTYTPQAVVDGQVGLVGSDEAALRAAIARARQAGPGIPVTLARDGEQVVAQVGAGTGAEGGGSAGRVLLIGYDPSHTTRVLRGENAGRTIEQANIVRSLRDLGRWSGSAATFASARPEGEAAALLLQSDDGRILGAARLAPSPPLPPPLPPPGRSGRPCDDARRSGRDARARLGAGVGIGPWSRYAACRGRNDGGARMALEQELATLMTAAQGGDAAAYRALLKACLPVVSAIARAQGVRGEAVDDVVQDALMTVHRARASYDPARPFLPWLRAITQRRAIDRLRRAGRRPREVNDPLAYEAEVDPGPAPARG